MGPLVGDHVQLAYLHRAGVGAEILIEQVCDGAGIRHHAGVAGKGVGLAHVGHAHEHRRLRQNDVGAVDLEEGRQQLCDGGDIHIRVDIVLEDQRQLVQDIGNAHGAGALEQTCVEVALHIQAVDIGVCIAVAVAAAHKELRRGTIQISVALQQLTAAVGHIPGDIHLDAAEVIHHFHQRLHINGDIVVDGQVVLVVDDICQRGNAAAVGKRHRVDLVVGNGIGLAVGEGKLAVLGGHQRVAGDLQHPQCTALDIELAVQDHIRHAVVGAGVAVRASLFKVDAADQNVDHIALVLFGGLDLLYDGGGTFRRADTVLHLVHKAHTVHHHTGDHGDHSHHNGKGQPQRGLFLLFAAARCVIPAHVGLCRAAGRGSVLCPGGAAGVLLRGSLRGARRLTRAAE